MKHTDAKTHRRKNTHTMKKTSRISKGSKGEQNEASKNNRTPSGLNKSNRLNNSREKHVSSISVPDKVSQKALSASRHALSKSRDTFGTNDFPYPNKRDDEESPRHT